MLKLHHDKHHQAYIAGDTTTRELLTGARAADDLETIIGLEKAFHRQLSKSASEFGLRRACHPQPTGSSTAGRETPVDRRPKPVPNVPEAIETRRFRIRARANPSQIVSLRRTAVPTPTDNSSSPPTRPSAETREAELADARTKPHADREPTADEERLAEGHELDPDVSEHAEEMAQRGADQEGEGRLP
jgi:hypothetical protein